jgi:hypothetical protein
MEPFYPVMVWNRSLKKHRADHIVNGIESTLGFTILWISVWERHPQNHTIGGKEHSEGGIIELTSIVTLDNFDGAVKLCGDISEKI